MTCQSCQTWNSEDEHRCRRCGRRFRVTPTRHPRSSYPIAATALAYQPEMLEEQEELNDFNAIAGSSASAFFESPNEGRVIPFDQLTSPAERQSIRARAAQLSQPAPVQSAKVEVSAWRNRPSSAKPKGELQLDLFGKSQIMVPPSSAIHCGAPVAPPLVRLNAALVDGFLVLLGTLLALGVFRLAAGSLPTEKYDLLAYSTLFCGVALTYKLLWCVMNRDSIGLTKAGLRTVDFDGNQPNAKRRFWRAFSSFLSLGAAGLGLIWTFADADALAWHDQISGTFPTFLDAQPTSADSSIQ